MCSPTTNRSPAYAGYSPAYAGRSSDPRPVTDWTARTTAFLAQSIGLSVQSEISPAYKRPVHDFLAYVVPLGEGLLMPRV